LARAIAGVALLTFEDHILSKLLRAGILVEVRAAGSPKYKLGVPLAAVADALATCKGSFEQFLKIAGEKSYSKSAK